MHYVVVERDRVCSFGVSESPPVGSIPISSEEYDLLIAQPNSYMFLDDSLVYDPPPSVYHVWTDSGWQLSESILNTYRELQWTKVKEERTRRKWGGIRINVSGTYYWIHSDEESRLQHLGLVITAVMSMLGMTQFPTGTPWKTMEENPDGTPKELALMTAMVAFQIFSADTMADITNFGVGRQHKTNIWASNDPANYDYSTGWLPIFGE